MPTDHDEDTTPAWNARAPDVTSEVANTSELPMYLEHSIDHVLLNPALAGKSVKAFVTNKNGEKKKNGRDLIPHKSGMFDTHRTISHIDPSTSRHCNTKAP